MNTLVCFRTGDGNYAVPVERVREVCKGETLVTLPAARDGVVGLLHYGDEAVTVISAFGSRRSSSDAERDQVLVLSTADHNFGLLVEEVTQVVKATDDVLLPPPSGQDHGYISGVLSTETGLVLVVDVDALDTRLVARLDA